MCYPPKKRRVVFLCLVAVFSIHFASGGIAPVMAQVEAPNEEYLFSEDNKKLEKQRSQAIDRLTQTDRAPSEDIQFEGQQVEYLKESKEVAGRGGVIVSGNGIQAQGDSGKVGLESKDLDFQGNVVLSTPNGNIRADRVQFNLDSELGTFENATFTLEKGAYVVEAKKAEKLSDTRYKLEDCILSTCHCPDGSRPWQISSDRVNITQEGYAHGYSSTIDVYGVPVLYTPWFAFPVKQERSSGLLVPTFGYSTEDGAEYELPLYLVLDDYSDLLVTPFGQTRTRFGSQFDYRRAFSTRSQLQAGFLYSDERPRDGDLRGTITTDVFDPAIDDNRLGGYWVQTWRNESDSAVPLSFLADAHLVSDNLLLRELDVPKIGLSKDRYTSSRVVMGASLSEHISTTLLGEYNQSLLTNQDLVFQRAPSLTINGLQRLRPFGFNPYGVQLNTNVKLETTDFVRDTGYDGWRTDLHPSVAIPFHYKNYVNTELTLGVQQTWYSLRDRLSPTTMEELDSSPSRTIGDIEFDVNTALERVYDLDPDNWLTYATSLGSRSQQFSLQRVKHTFEPRIRYNYIPGVSQNDLPIFDAYDRIRERSLITGELRSRLLGSFRSPQAQVGPIEELAPEVEEVSYFEDFYTLDDIDNSFRMFRSPISGFTTRLRTAPGQIRELASVKLIQSYDITEERKDLDPLREPLSDLGLNLALYPSSYFGLQFMDNLDVENGDFSSWGVASHFRDDRGDALRARYTYVDNSVSQLEANLELVLDPRLRIGYYTRFDDLESEFIEQRMALRISSACDCWHVDVGMSDQINPDRKKFLLNITFEGIGDLVQDFGIPKDKTREGQ